MARRSRAFAHAQWRARAARRARPHAGAHRTIIEGLGVGAAVKRSSSLFAQTWSENVTARVGFGLLGFLLALPAVLLVVVGVAAGTIGAGIAIAVAVVWLLAVTLVMASLSSIFQTALHLYAAEHEVPTGYSGQERFRQASGSKGTAPA